MAGALAEADMGVPGIAEILGSHRFDRDL
jgi:hypothetical protein